MNDTPLLTEAELAAIERIYALEQLSTHTSRLFADLHRYRAWCRRLAGFAGVKQLSGIKGDNIYALANEVQATLEESQR